MFPAVETGRRKGSVKHGRHGESLRPPIEDQRERQDHEQGRDAGDRHERRMVAQYRS